jgi:prepilin-type N-terminal cleavage/methylation domain-containing protein
MYFIPRDIGFKARRLEFSERGFTMIEIMVSLGLAGIAFSGLLTAFVGHSNHNTKIKRIADAGKAASEALDILRAAPFDSLPRSGIGTGEFGDFDVDVDGQSYHVDVEYCLESSFCTKDSLHITARAYLGSEKFSEIEVVYGNFE